MAQKKEEVDCSSMAACAAHAVGEEPAMPATSLSSSTAAEPDSGSEPSQRETGPGSCESVDPTPVEPASMEPECPLRSERESVSVAPSVLAVERECRSRPQTRRARIRELLKRLEVAQSPCPADRMRVDARQKEAKERHLRQASGASSSGPASSPALSLRRSRSFMELVASDSQPHFASARSSAVDPSVLEDVVSRLPAKPVTSCSPEPCTICLEVPAPGWGNPEHVMLALCCIRVRTNKYRIVQTGVYCDVQLVCKVRSSPPCPAATGTIPSVSRRLG